MKNYIKKNIVFEVKSLIGRLFLNKKPPLSDAKNYLNLGCAQNIVDGFVNADFFKLKKPWTKDKRKLQWQLDLRYPLNCANGVFDGIHSEHVIEHLSPDHVEKLFKELFRIMKSGSLIRIIVPDIEKYVNFYTGKLSDDEEKFFKEKYKNGCLAIGNITQNHGHLSAWDFENLSEKLKEAGFSNIKKLSFLEGSEKKLLIDSENRKWESLYVEAVKK